MFNSYEEAKPEIKARLETAERERKLKYPDTVDGPPISDAIVDFMAMYIVDSDQAYGMQEDDLMLTHHLELMYDFLLFVEVVQEETFNRLHAQWRLEDEPEKVAQELRKARGR